MPHAICSSFPPYVSGQGRFLRTGSLEQSVLGIHRTGEDVPGWSIPTLYANYLRSGDAQPLTGVFYHNRLTCYPW
ncbi:MAG: ribonuclease H-like domain-containing protein [Chloroflexota bacterium]